VTRARKVGPAAPPLEGPAKTRFAFWFASVAVSDPVVVIGLTVTVKMLGSIRPTLVTVPEPAGRSAAVRARNVGIVGPPVVGPA
jgi:hypothetical protein